MSSPALHLLLPFALMPEYNEEEKYRSLAQTSASALEERPAIEAQLAHMPALRRIVRKATQLACIHAPTDARSCAHEQWLADYFQIGSASDHYAEEAPLAPYALLAEGGDPGEALWAYVRPVHFELARTHLSLRASEGLNLSAEHAQTLFETAHSVAAHYNLTLIAPTLSNWYLCGDALQHLIGSTPYRAEGQNIEHWLPYSKTGDSQAVRTWMQFQNEVQMTWNAHSVNIEREAQGQLPANAIWFWGQGALSHPSSSSFAAPFSAVFSHSRATQGLALAASLPMAPPPTAFINMPALTPIRPVETDAAYTVVSNRPVLIELEDLMQSALTHDKQTWQTALAKLEHDWFQPALTALQTGQLSSLIITLTGETQALTLHLCRADLYKMWRHRTLPKL
jgi:hypothetical protein